jgi:hypothetical protein
VLTRRATPADAETAAAAAAVDLEPVVAWISRVTTAAPSP